MCHCSENRYPSSALPYRALDWQMFAMASLILVIAYLVDAAARRWRKGGPDARRKAIAVSLGMALPMLSTIIYAHLVVFGVLQGSAVQPSVVLGRLVVMAYELGRDVILRRRAQLELTELREQLAQAERVSVLGQLASALAHELIQPLAATAANVEAALTQLEGEKTGSRRAALNSGRHRQGRSPCRQNNQPDAPVYQATRHRDAATERGRRGAGCYLTGSLGSDL